MDLGENLIPHKIEKTLVERDLGIEKGETLLSFIELNGKII